MHIRTNPSLYIRMIKLLATVGQEGYSDLVLIGTSVTLLCCS